MTAADQIVRSVKKVLAMGGRPHMTYGKCWVTVLDDKGRAYVSDVKEGDLWYFPVQDDDVIQTFAADRADEALDIGVLSG